MPSTVNDIINIMKSWHEPTGGGHTPTWSISDTVSFSLLSLNASVLHLASSVKAALLSHCRCSPTSAVSSTNEFSHPQSPGPLSLFSSWERNQWGRVLWLKYLLTHWQFSFCGPCWTRQPQSCCWLSPAALLWLPAHCLFSGVRTLDTLRRSSSLPRLWGNKDGSK